MKKALIGIILCSLFSNVIHSGPINASVELFFTPQDQVEMYEKILNLLNSARSKVSIAAYTITSQSIINTLLSLRKRGVTIEIIYDESSEKQLPIMQELLNNNIIPVIFPSKFHGKGLMHNKFIIVDGSVVWTGSANFTKTAFDPLSRYNNHENAVIITSEQAANEFTKAFLNIETKVFTWYIYFIADYNVHELPEWIKLLTSLLYKKNYRFGDQIQKLAHTLAPHQIEKINSIFPYAIPKPKSITPRQKRYLTEHGHSEKSLETISSQEASELIKEAIQAKKKSQRRPRPY